MKTKYGSIDIQAQIQRKKRSRSVIPSTQVPAELTPETLERRLAELSFQNRAPSVAKAAAETLLERKAPRSKSPEQAITAADAARIAEIYDRIFGDRCPHCDKAVAK